MPWAHAVWAVRNMEIAESLLRTLITVHACIYIRALSAVPLPPVPCPRSQAAVDMMRKVLNSVQMDGVVIIGEGEKDEVGGRQARREGGRATAVGGGEGY